MIKLVIFDLDGTLVNSIEFWLSLYKKTVKKFGVEIDEKELKKRFGKKDVDILISLTPKDKQEKILKYYHNLKKKEKNYVDLNKFEYADKVLGKIKRKGIKIAVATGNTKDIAEFIIKKNKLDKYIDYLVTNDDVEKGKPAPDMILKILKHFGLEKKEVLSVGDAIYDYEAAKNAGIKSALVKTGVLDGEECVKCNPDYVFNDIRDILKLL
ncbi:MAG: hypothetical protein B6D55_05750 [Candidatus Omnitrophica bacterium 4484_70.2]|nr:MAG: hypothetical protein B6D55_05750 [Candidatus Omnitrophica bacterium 4484_70.2]